MPTYKIRYTFNGTGEVFIDAKSPKKAKELFYEGQFSDQQEDGYDYEIEEVIKQ